MCSLKQKEEGILRWGSIQIFVLIFLWKFHTKFEVVCQVTLDIWSKQVTRQIIMWVCTDCPNPTCSLCSEKFCDLEYAIEHVRKHHDRNIKRPAGAVGDSDSHGRVWYCFGCETDRKDHRSYNSSEAMYQHLKDCHGCGLVHIDQLVNRLDVEYCTTCG